MTINMAQKFAILIMRREQRQIREGIELPKQARISWRNGNLQVIGNIGSGY